MLITKNAGIRVYTMYIII